jgi:hypothetical protein
LFYLLKSKILLKNQIKTIYLQRIKVAVLNFKIALKGKQVNDLNHKSCAVPATVS